MRSRYGSRRRLKSAAAFDAVFKRGTRLSGRLFLVVYAPNRTKQHRLGLAVGRRVGGAVARNRAKRLLRESFRRAGGPARAGYDLVVVAHPALVACRQAEVDRELRERLRRIDVAAAGSSGAPAAAGA
jgi:ribonuclease P protein component